VRISLASLVLAALWPVTAVAGSETPTSIRLFKVADAYCQRTVSPDRCVLDAVPLVRHAIVFDIAAAALKLAVAAGDAANGRAFYDTAQRRQAAIEDGLAALYKKYPAR
jgi:hypothetical protein